MNKIDESTVIQTILSEIDYCIKSGINPESSVAINGERIIDVRTIVDSNNEKFIFINLVSSPEEIENNFCVETDGVIAHYICNLCDRTSIIDYISKLFKYNEQIRSR